MGPAPLSPAIAIEDFVYVSGQVGIDPATGKIVEGGVVEQTRQTCENIKALLASEGLTMAHVVKSLCFMTDAGDFAAMNGVYAAYFPDPKPARSTVGIVLADPRLLVEIEVVAHRKAA
ncbi:RidA family protein [Ancylobacter terrae]|uniref:RidA family protein n=1 Tax=Ancylobacter sp. sgz301288 TaxID=3342077 RepID=UPI00385C4AA7